VLTMLVLLGVEALLVCDNGDPSVSPVTPFLVEAGVWVWVAPAPRLARAAEPDARPRDMARLSGPEEGVVWLSSPAPAGVRAFARELAVGFDGVPVTCGLSGAGVGVACGFSAVAGRGVERGGPV
jgi:hypothetical protein